MSNHKVKDLKEWMKPTYILIFPNIIFIAREQSENRCHNQMNQTLQNNIWSFKHEILYNVVKFLKSKVIWNSWTKNVYFLAKDTCLDVLGCHCSLPTPHSQFVKGKSKDTETEFALARLIDTSL